MIANKTMGSFTEFKISNIKEFSKSWYHFLMILETKTLVTSVVKDADHVRKDRFEQIVE